MWSFTKTKWNYPWSLTINIFAKKKKTSDQSIFRKIVIDRVKRSIYMFFILVRCHRFIIGKIYSWTPSENNNHVSIKHNTFKTMDMVNQVFTSFTCSAENVLHKLVNNNKTKKKEKTHTKLTAVNHSKRGKNKINAT